MTSPRRALRYAVAEPAPREVPDRFRLADWIDETEKPLPHHWSSDSPANTAQWRRVRAWRRWLDARRAAGVTGSGMVA